MGSSAYRRGSNPAASAATSRAAIRSAADGVRRRLSVPAHHGTDSSIETRSARRVRPAGPGCRSSTVSCVRTATMPQPTSTPTAAAAAAAGMIARSVGIADPTVAPVRGGRPA